MANQCTAGDLVVNCADRKTWTASKME